MSGARSGHDDSRAPAYERPRWDLWLYGTVIVTVIVVAASWLSPWVRHEWALSLGRQDIPYTQLAFDSAAALPATAVRGKNVPVSFVITNKENKQVSYKYIVASGSGTELVSLSSATKVVAAGASWYVKTTVTPKCPASACRVQVSLPQQAESIDFEFTYQNPSKTKSAKSK
jgi:hypothetical protein